MNHNLFWFLQRIECYHFVLFFFFFNSLCSFLDLPGKQDDIIATTVSKTNDLAEADQENNSPSNIPSNSSEIFLGSDLDDGNALPENENEVIGAVGGIESLPDLAKVTTNPNHHDNDA